MTPHCYFVGGTPLMAACLDLPGADSILSEVVENDCYHLSDLHRSGYRIDVAVDVGAHMGFFGLMIHHFWPEARVIGFEPDPDLLTCAQANYRGDPSDLFNAAIRYDGRHTLYVRPDWTGGTMIYDPAVNHCDDIPKTYLPREIRTFRLEDVVRHETIDLLKLDCEGSEYDILRSMASERAARIRRIVGEFHDGYAQIEAIIKDRFSHLQPRLLTEPADAAQGIFEAA